MKQWARPNVTNGRKIIDVKSSSFSVSAIAKPPSCGMARPARKAPKIACTPITSVKKADVNISMMEMVIMSGVGPFSVLPVRRAIQSMTHLTGMRITSDHAIAVSKIYRAERPEPALTSATVRASSVHPTISLPTPALNTTIPIVVSSSFSSVRIRHCSNGARRDVRSLHSDPV